MISSTASAPACSMMSWWVSAASAAGSASIRSSHSLSQSGLRWPNRAPFSWCDMPPVPSTTTRRSSGKLSAARRIARPSFQQRAAVGSGCWITLTASGTVRTGQPGSWSKQRCIGTMKPCSTASSWHSVMSNSS